MANEQNLIPNSERTPSELREMTRNGGINSGIARRRKRSMREAAELFLSLPVMDGQALEQLRASGVEDRYMDNQMAIVAAMTINAMYGDSRAAKIVMEMIGEAEHEEKAGLTKSDIDSVSSFITGAMRDAGKK